MFNNKCACKPKKSLSKVLSSKFDYNIFLWYTLKHFDIFKLIRKLAILCPLNLMYFTVYDQNYHAIHRCLFNGMIKNV